MCACVCLRVFGCEFDGELGGVFGCEFGRSLVVPIFTILKIIQLSSEHGSRRLYDFPAKIII